MKIYYAARFSQKELVITGHREITKRGHTLAADWTTHQNIKPYVENQTAAAEYAREDLQGVIDCDVFILHTDREIGCGSSGEFGGALILNQTKGSPLVYVIGEHITDEMFYFHPAVKRREALAEVLDEIGENELQRARGPLKP